MQKVCKMSTRCFPLLWHMNITKPVLNYNHVLFLSESHYQILQEKGLLTVHALTHKGGPAHICISNTNAPECHVVATVSWKIRAVLSASRRKPTPDPGDPPSEQLTMLQFAHHWLIQSPFSRPAPNRHIPRLWMLTTTSASEPFGVDTIALSSEQGSTVNTSADFICKTHTKKKKHLIGWGN